MAIMTKGGHGYTDERRDMALLRKGGKWLYCGKVEHGYTEERWDMALVGKGGHGFTEERGTWL